MIKNLSEMLEALRQAEAKMLNNMNVVHAPTIGEMYEGLTAQILARALPSGLDLRIVTGFAVDGLGGQTGQLDCMLVRGEGIPVPYVNGVFQWHIKDVLAVIEVKKNLNGGELVSAFDQLSDVARICSSWLQSVHFGQAIDLRASMRAYAECTGEVAPPPQHWANMDRARHLIMHSIMIDQICPVRIILGYFGYTTENGIRKGFQKFLSANLNKVGFGPPRLPNLVIADGVTLVKLSGHPHHSRLTNDGYWPIIASSHVNPTILILEAIWTRISYSSPLASLFGDDLEIERLSPFLEALPVIAKSVQDRSGWQMRYLPMTPKQLAAGDDFSDWEPIELDSEQFVVIERLCNTDILVDEPELLAFLVGAGKEPDEFFQSLIDTSLVARNGAQLVLTTVQCQTMILPDGQFIAAENNTGRLTRWVSRYIERRSQK